MFELYCSSWGCGAHFNGKWIQLPWSVDWAPITIMAKELVPILLSYAVWNKILSKRKIEFTCDNCSVVEAVKKGSLKDIMAMHLLQCLWLLTAIFDIQISVPHIPGVLNTSADLLSRNQLKQFLMLHPQASTVCYGNGSSGILSGMEKIHYFLYKTPHNLHTCK